MSQDEPTKIEFIASLPPLQSAIQIDGLEGARIKLDISEKDILAVVKLSAFKGSSFKVTIESVKDEK